MENTILRKGRHLWKGLVLFNSMVSGFTLGHFPCRTVYINEAKRVFTRAIVGYLLAFFSTCQFRPWRLGLKRFICKTQLFKIAQETPLSRGPIEPHKPGLKLL